MCVYYLQCLQEILFVPASIQTIVVVGDNDIGGEGDEAMKPEVNQ